MNKGQIVEEGSSESTANRNKNTCQLIASIPLGAWEIQQRQQARAQQVRLALMKV